MTKRADSNQPAIVKALRRAGATVQHLHQIGRGCPDILIGYQGRNFLAEIKDGSKPPSKRKLTPDEADWHEQWAGQVAVIITEKEALRLLETEQMC